MNDITIYDKINDPIDAVERLGHAFANSGMFGCKTAGAGATLALACMCEKKNPIDICRTYHLIDNKLSMRSDAMLAEFKTRGGKCKWINIGDDGKEASAEWEFDGQKMTIRYTIDDAKRAGLVKPGSGWMKDPGAMLRARCTSKAIRILAPEIVAGVYAPEEITDEKSVPAPLFVKQAAEKTEKEITTTVVDTEPAVEEEAAPPSWNKTAELENRLSDHEDAVNLWLIQKNLIPANGSFRDVTNELASQILDRTDAFLAKVQADMEGVK